MTTPHITVVIPTRNRAQTLLSCLRTCSAQRYANFTILVSDNASTDNTRAVVEAAGDSRIRYFNTGYFVSMSDNWEFALSHVAEGYVTFIGDDDGLLPDAIADLARLLEGSGARALCWLKAEYHWPNHRNAALRHKLLLPPDNLLLEVDARLALRDARRLWLPYNRLPCIYNSLVSVAVLRELRVRTGRFFGSITPDVYSGFALLSVLDSYLFSSRPFSVNGASAASNGAAFTTGVAAAPAAIPLPLDGIEPIVEHRDFPVIHGVVYSVILEALAQANDRCFGSRLPPPVKQGIRRMVAEISRMSRRDPEVLLRALSGCRALAVHARQLSYFDRMTRKFGLSGAAPVSVPSPAGMTPRALSDGGYVSIDACNLPIHDIEQASVFIGAQLGPYRQPPQRSRYSFALLVASLRLTDFTLVKLLGQLRHKFLRM